MWRRSVPMINDAPPPPSRAQPSGLLVLALMMDHSLACHSDWSLLYQRYCLMSSFHLTKSGSFVWNFSLKVWCQEISFNYKVEGMHHREAPRNLCQWISDTFLLYLSKKIITEWIVSTLKSDTKCNASEKLNRTVSDIHRTIEAVSIIEPLTSGHIANFNLYIL